MKRILLIVLSFLILSCTTVQKQIVLDSSMLTLEVRALDSQLISIYDDGTFLTNLSEDELETVKGVKNRYSGLRKSWSNYVQDPRELVLNLNSIFDGYGVLYADYLKIRTIIILHKDEYSDKQLVDIEATNNLILRANTRFLKVVEESRQEEILLSYINLASQIIKVAVLL